MRIIPVIFLLFINLAGSAQTVDDKLIATLKDFHIALVQKNTVTINQHTDKALSYGHSNGWVETKAELISNLETGHMTYNSYREDSIAVMINGNRANVRFIADIKATRNNITGDYHLKVLEVWVKKSRRWILFARQAVREIKN